MRALIRRTDPILIQAVIAAALSFAHLHDIAEAAGQGGWKAWAYPVSVDLLMVMAWKRIRTKDNESKTGSWFWFLLSLGASLSANIGTSGVLDMHHLPTTLRVIVAGWPAIAFLGGSLLVHSRKPTEADDSREAPAQELQTAVSGPPTGVVEEETRKAPEPAQKHLVSYSEAALAVGVATETVRGWANNGKVKKYPGPTPSTVRVDLVECTALQNGRVAVGG